MLDAMIQGANHLPFKYKKVAHYLSTAAIKQEIFRAFSWFSSLDGSQLLSRDFRQDFVFPEDIVGRMELRGFNAVDAVAYIDMKYWLPDNLLERADRLTMANSIELRVPFLDHELIEFCYNLHHTAKIARFNTKKILRRMMHGKLPNEILHRKKVGFTTPISHWLKRELKKEWMSDIILSDRLRHRGIFDQRAVEDSVQ